MFLRIVTFVLGIIVKKQSKKKKREQQAAKSKRGASRQRDAGRKQASKSTSKVSAKNKRKRR